MGILPTSPPSVPLPLAEMLYVAFSSALDHLDRTGEYPVGMRENMRKVLQKYDKDRRTALTNRGIKSHAVGQYTARAAEKLAEWLDEQAVKHERTDGDFDAWAQELMSDE